MRVSRPSHSPIRHGNFDERNEDPSPGPLPPKLGEAFPTRCPQGSRSLNEFHDRFFFGDTASRPRSSVRSSVARFVIDSAWGPGPKSCSGNNGGRLTPGPAMPASLGTEAGAMLQLAGPNTIVKISKTCVRLVRESGKTALLS